MKTIKVLTIQSEELKLRGRVYPNGNCNHSHALPIYKRLFDDYNKLKNTSYDNFFWAFSDLLTDNLSYAVNRSAEMIGMYISDESTENVLILEVPDDICLATDFYNFSDEIFAYEFPNELESNWENIYSERKSEKQIIFPYIDESMLIKIYKLSLFK